jgi:predicted nucleotidyltransferase component of viral defense system
MLQSKAIDVSTYQLLHELNLANHVMSFSLGGGTALALQLGHRISVDLDFFSETDFETETLINSLSKSYNLNDISSEKNSLRCTFQFGTNEIKVDFLKHGYHLLRPILETEDIRLLSLEDVTAMKLNAIANRGAKKDFFDIYALLEKYSIEDMVSLFEEKYPLINSFSVIKSLTYFDDAEKDPNPISLMNVKWSEVKQKIQTVVMSN